MWKNVKEKLFVLQQFPAERHISRLSVSDGQTKRAQ